MNHSDYSSTCMMMAQQQQPAARQISQSCEAASKKHSHGTGLYLRRPRPARRRLMMSACSFHSSMPISSPAPHRSRSACLPRACGRAATQLPASFDPMQQPPLV